MTWESPVVWQIGREDDGVASLELLCNEGKKDQMRLVRWPWDPS